MEFHQDSRLFQSVSAQNGKVWGYTFNILTGGLAIFVRMCVHVSVCPAVAFTATMEGSWHSWQCVQPCLI